MVGFGVVLLLFCVGGFFGDELDVFDCWLLLDQVFDVVDVFLFDVVFEEDVGDYFVVDFVGCVGGCLYDWDEDVEYEYCDEHGCHRGEGGYGVAFERLQCFV